MAERHRSGREAGLPAVDRRGFLRLGAGLVGTAVVGSSGRVLPGGPVGGRPRPTAAQLRWQREEVALFVHFGMNTFTGREWGDGREDPALFNPTALDARQWARVARAAGGKALVLTA